MSVQVMIFGQLTDIFGSATVELPSVKDSNELQQILIEKYPLLANTKYRIAIDKQFVSGNVNISAETAIALLPPFSGG